MVIEAGIGDQTAVTRNSEAAIGALTIGKRLNLAVINADFVNLGIQRVVFPIVVTIGGYQDVLAVGCPVHGRVVIKVTAGDLSRRTTFGGDDKYMCESLLEKASTIEAIRQVVDHPHRIRPFRALRLGGHRRAPIPFFRDMHRESQPPAIG